MSNTVVPRMQGDDYQALIFWIAACQLFKPASKVVTVGFDVSTMKVFDDVTIHYREPIRDGRNDLIDGRFQQIKFHTDSSGAWGYESLIDPAFINAKEVSLLKRLHDANVCARGRKYKRNFMVLSSWPINHMDLLGELIDCMDGKVRLDRLFDGSGSRSALGRIRELWKTHLGIDSNDELAELLRPLRIEYSQTMHQTLQRLNTELELVGLSPVQEGSLINPYIGLIRDLRAKGIAEFNKEQLENFCGEEGLLRNKVLLQKNVRTAGIRSFVRGNHPLEEEAEALLTLAQYFDGRAIKRPLDWGERVVPEVEDFIQSLQGETTEVELHLDTHITIAVLAGYLVSSKSRCGIYPVQHSLTGHSVWKPVAGTSDTSISREFKSETMFEQPEGTDAILAISISHDILNDVQMFRTENLPGAKSILHFSVLPHSSTISVMNSNHALRLVEQVRNVISEYRYREKYFNLIHMFIAAPAGFAFFLGQHLSGLGQIQLYEYSFESFQPGRYQPSILLPLEQNPQISQKRETK